MILELIVLFILLLILFSALALPEASLLVFLGFVIYTLIYIERGSTVPPERPGEFVFDDGS